MAIQPLRGFRDFYPPNYATIRYLRDTIATVCRRFGYEQFDGPCLEPLSLYAAKSSDEIVREQAFTFTDRGGEPVVLRPELTPTLARMVAAKQNELVFPLRWWSWGQFWRYERPQKGRGREFYQWNADLIGDDSPQADAEMIELAIRVMETLGLSRDDVVIELSDRDFVARQLTDDGIEAAAISKLFTYLDKSAKKSPDQRRDLAQKIGLNSKTVERVETLLADPKKLTESPRLREVMAVLNGRGLEEWVALNASLVRGFAYYTGLVFEARDKKGEFRAICGGGRYSNLVASVGGKPLSGVGLAMGDMVVTELVESLGKPIPDDGLRPVVVIAYKTAPLVEQTVADLRQADVAVIVIPSDIAKGLKFADRRQARLAVIIGPDEIAKDAVSVKNLATSQQKVVAKNEVVAFVKSQLAPGRARTQKTGAGGASGGERRGDFQPQQKHH